MNARVRLFIVALVVAALALAPLVLGSFSVSLLNDIGIGALVALGLVLLTGVGGATSFGQAAFVAAIMGGMVTYPLTAVGALAVGLVESFASFWSGALKDVIVFSLLIPVLMMRSFFAPAQDEEEEIDE